MPGCRPPSLNAIGIVLGFSTVGGTEGAQWLARLPAGQVVTRDRPNVVFGFVFGTEIADLFIRFGLF